MKNAENCENLLKIGDIWWKLVRKKWRRKNMKTREKLLKVVRSGNKTVKSCEKL